MGVEVIYVVRHGFRMNWVVDPETGTYNSSTPTPTGIPSDPALASYGVQQAEQLADKVLTLDPPVDVVYSSPFYRCLQTLKPSVERLFAEGKGGGKVRVENGLGEFYGLARFDHPSPAPLSVLQSHFETLHPTYTPLIVPSTNGESIPDLHDRIAYTLHRIIDTLDADPSCPRAILICTHAASMIAIGRALTGRMPEDIEEEDFKCFTCSLSRFERRRQEPNTTVEVVDVEDWDSEKPNVVPRLDWRGKGVRGGWDCTVNGDCSFLAGGEERGWRFSDPAEVLDAPTSPSKL
ncbi:phosphoglycerate mutase family protein [Saccharata proteae CBS 121410]|uniref:Phosphoglycerate mutase family protein n=1 Tax=Saccharata proteae CBS 121410 TaxID=1314787 RepID=A0A9P4LWJ3_9PEZI|nr:phosphoglycerate mutase family protein [Saccharata proteae CBS 121410]